MVPILSISTPTMLSVTAAKRKFFQSHDPYVKYHHRNKVAKDGDITSRNGSVSNSLPSSACTVYGSTFSCSSSIGNKKYFIACNSNGCIAVWDHQASSSIDSNTSGKKSGLLEPILTVSVGGGGSNNVLYDLQFIETNGDHLLVASGDPGIMIYKWSHFEETISAAMDKVDDANAPIGPKCQDPSSTTIHPSTFGLISPIATFKPHPSPATSFGESVEINSTSYNKWDDIIVGAAGDMFGCYQWDIATEKLLGTFGGISRSDYGRGGHKDYLHVVKSLPGTVGGSSQYVTGGEDGKIGFWDGKTRRLVDMMNIQATMDKNKDLVTSNIKYSRGFLNSNSSSTPSWNNNGLNISSWVSSMDISNNWLAVCGGSETSNNNSITTSRSSAGGFTNTSGFMTLWHLPTRTFTSGCATRESLNTVAYHDSLDCLVSGGNEGRISFWGSITTLGQARGRAWSTPPATYTISVDSESNCMIVGGSGGVLDCFMDRVKVSQLLLNS